MEGVTTSKWRFGVGYWIYMPGFSGRGPNGNTNLGGINIMTVFLKP